MTFDIIENMVISECNSTIDYLPISNTGIRLRKTTLLTNFTTGNRV